MMETAISVNKFIYSILNNDLELKKMVGKNIYPLIAEENVTFPFIIFKKTNIDTTYSKDGRVYDECEFVILIVSNKYNETVDIAERVRQLLECRSDEHFKQIRINSIREDYVEDSYIQEISFQTIIA